MEIAQHISAILTTLTRFPAAKLLVVTKKRSKDEIEEALRSGISIIGENRVQEMEDKHGIFTSSVEKHLIGHLQTNKVKKAVRLFDVIESVDSIDLARSIDKESAKAGMRMKIFLQVNISDDIKKYGFKREEFVNMYTLIAQLEHVKICGLMTILNLMKSSTEARLYYHEMKALHTYCIHHFGIPASDFSLSMGMSDDYEIALEEGSTLIRIGTKIFE